MYKKHILLIATGGTIACMAENGLLTPKISKEDLLKFVPELDGLCNISSIQPFNKDSTNMTYEDWFELSKLIKKNYYKYDGFLITHGTDTLAYASASLSYLIQNSSKPIVLTGAQKPIIEVDTDAKRNLYDAFLYCCSDGAKGVRVVFDGKVMLGTRSKKIRSKSFNAFSSVDYPNVGEVKGSSVKQFLSKEEEKKDQEDPNVIFADRINSNVISIKLTPGLRASIFEKLDDYSAIVIEGYGVGGIPNYRNNEFEVAFKKLREKNIKIIITTQVHHEGTDMDIYEVGKVKKDLHLLEARNMTIEAIVGKTVWALAKANDDHEFEKLFYTTIDYDIF